MMYFNHALRKLAVVASLVLSVSGCAPNPQDDIPLFKTFIAENIDKVSEDPYISSTVRPGDALYRFFVQLQHGRVKEEVYEPLKGGDSESKLWYAKLSLPYNELRGEVYQFLTESMQAGNPYAALELSEQGEFCQRYGKGSARSKLFNKMGLSTIYESDVCDEAYFELAVEGFEKLAQQGDLRAQYFFLKQKNWDQSTETRAEYIQEIIRFAEAHYYQPLMDYVGTILFYSKEENKDISNTQEQHELAIKLLTIASNNNYIPAIYKLYFATINKDEKEKLINKSFVLGDIRMIKYQLFKEQGGSPEQYYYNAIIKELSGHYLFSPEKSGKEPDVQLQAEKFAESIRSSVYIDGFTDSGDWN
ncbi:sel1 repeat family protein [Vibrio maritimus]|uniref:sel1 repeat family protein n=1 Tax=Vibrio maritimus TaxID=990268 RepID=UPI001F27D154|nr:sel1 repeat family protein [Vibrio maritimus]